MTPRLLAAAALLLAACPLAAHAGDPRGRHVEPSLAFTTFAGGGTAEGLTCGFDGHDDPTGDTYAEVGVIWSPPVLFNPPGTDQIVCALQLTSQYHTGVDEDRVDQVATGVVAVAPHDVWYAANPSATIYVCTAWRHNGVVMYYDAPSGTFSPSSSVVCAAATP